MIRRLPRQSPKSRPIRVLPLRRSSATFNVRTFKRPPFFLVPIPILELTPHIPVPSLLKHLRATHFATPLFSNSCMEWGGLPPSPAKKRNAS
jgi:hypothetical protein